MSEHPIYDTVDSVSELTIAINRETWLAAFCRQDQKERRAHLTRAIEKASELIMRLERARELGRPPAAPPAELRRRDAS